MTQQDPTADELRLRHATVSALQASLLRTTTVEAFLQTVVDRAGEHVAAHSACTLTMLREGRFLTVASTDPEATEADQVEYATDSGPCVEAARRGVETIVPDTACRGPLARVGRRLPSARLPVCGRGPRRYRGRRTAGDQPLRT